MNDIKRRKICKELMEKHKRQLKKDLYSAEIVDILEHKPEKPVYNSIEKQEKEFEKDFPLLDKLAKERFCHICNKLLKNKHGVLVHIGMKHKEIKNKVDKPIVRDIPRKKKTKIEKRTYFCNKHNRFHKHLFQGKPSMTYKKCLVNIYKFKDDMDSYQLFRIGFRKNWRKLAGTPEKEKKSELLNDEL